MLRALSTRRSPLRYEKLEDEAAATQTPDGKLTRATSVPSSSSNGLPGKLFPLAELKPKPRGEEKRQVKPEAKPAKTSHPLLAFFDVRRRKNKATAKPEFARYMEYLKEGGFWDSSSNKPVIYYK